MQKCYHFRQNTDLITSSGAMAIECLNQLASLDYQVVINLLPDTDRRAIQNEKHIVESQHIAYFFIPVDFSKPQESDYQEFYGILTSNPLKKMHIHCAANYRASVFYAVYAFESQLWSKYQAESFIIDIWQPQQHLPWLDFLQNHNLFL